MIDRSILRAGAIPLGALLFLLGGCGPGGSVEIATKRPRIGSDPVRAGASAAMRFGGEMPQAEAPFRFTLPEGWKDEGPAGMRKVNLSTGADTQCYLITLPGEGGGLVENLNRWRNEVGLAPIRAEEAAALPRIELLGEACPLLDVSGDYQGMGGSAGSDRTLLGTVLIRPTESLFIKMVGPSEEVLAHRDAFVAFVESLEEAP